MRENSCRICLNSDENELVELFGFSETQSHAQKLSFCAGIEVDDGAYLPRKICYDCLQKVEIACEIKEKFIETDQLLRKHLKPEPNEEHLEPESNFEIKLESDPDWVSFVGEASNYALPVLQKDEAPREEEFTEVFVKPSRRTSGHREKKSPIKKPSKVAGSQADRRETRVEDYSCVFCEMVFNKIFEKKEHMKAEHADELVCKICNRKRGSVLATERCIKDHQFGFSYLCQICARPFRRRCNLVDHIAEAHTDNPVYFSCDICGIKIRHKNSLKRHMRSVHMGEKFPCPFFEMCPTLFYSTKNSLNIHMYRHHNVPAPFYCDGCGDGFSNIAEVKVHQRKSCRGAARSNSAHGTPNGRRHPNISLSLYYDVIDGMFHCKLCPKVYSSKLKYSYHHTENHKDNKTCEICNKTFNQFTTFRRHMKVIHEKIKNFVCEYPGCGKTFARSHGLIIHKNTHTGEKPFACTLCSYRSGDTSSLFKHKKKMHP